MIFYLIGCFLFFYAFVNYKSAFLFFLLFKMLLVHNITLVSIPGIPLLTLDVFLTLLFVVVFYFKKKKITQDNRPFPFKIPFICIFISWTISMLFSVAGIKDVFSQYLRDVCEDLILIYMMWRIVYSREDFHFLLYGFLGLIIISCGYGIYEGIIQNNPLADYEATLNSDETRNLNFTYDVDSSRGYRIKSFFSHAIGAGMIWSMSIAILIYLKLQRYWSSKVNKLSLLVVSCCLVCVLLTNSRGPILFLLIILLGVIRFRQFYLLASFCLMMIIGWDFFSQFSDNIMSIFDSEAQEVVGGSNAKMRFSQLEAAYTLMSKSWIWGLGYKYTQYLNDWFLIERLLGHESMWFNILPEFGIIGVGANLILAYYSLIKLPVKYKSRMLFFLSLAYWITASLTSIPGFKMHYYYFFFILLVKKVGFNNKNYKMIENNFEK